MTLENDIVKNEYVFRIPKAELDEVISRAYDISPVPGIVTDPLVASVLSEKVVKPVSDMLSACIIKYQKMLSE